MADVTAPNARATLTSYRCPVCLTTFQGRVDPAPTICGSITCTALHTWTPEEWAGQARMANARVAAGVALNDLDRHALDRAPEALA